ELIETVERHPGVAVGEVSYLLLKDLKNEPREVSDLPFLKRAPYRPECEFRFIYESKRQERDFLDVSIPSSCIDRIYLSPWMPEAVADSVKEMLSQISAFEQSQITRSTLIQNDTWAKYGRNIVDAG